MANRPRLPNVDPEDLAKLANQYPGSRTADGTGSSETSTASSTGKDAPSSQKTDQNTGSSPSLSASASARSGTSGSGTSGSGPSGSGTSGSASPAPKRRGSWSAAFLTFLFALIALAAAVAAIGAPSYRGEIHALLTEYGKPYLNDDTIDILSGYDTQRLEVTYAGLDQRIARLNEALERVGATQGVSGDDARALMFRDDLAEKLDALSAQVGTLAQTTDTQAGQIADLDTDMTGVTDTLRAELEDSAAEVRGAIAAVQEEVAATRADLGVLTDRMAAAEGRTDDQAAASAELTGRLEEIEGRLGTLVTDFNGLLDLNDQVAQTVATFKNENMPILAVIQLRDAVIRAESFTPELAFAQRVLNGAPGIQDSLTTLAASAQDGIASIPQLRRDLRLIFNNMGTLVAKVESWSERVGSWFNMLVGSSTVPEARRGGGLVSAIATMDDALDRDDLELVIREGAALQSELRSAALADWLNAVVERLEATSAVRQLETVVYARSAVQPANPGASKVQ
ncbi:MULTISPECIES: hypothetical protein [Thalassobaculum]|uniref:Uncharacterized protein n=1 Tax=Thalassobaculum litoreum DSM 18839 TaxID=1123362 RepID=A0A8G2BIK2_9PROT|nr:MULTISPECIES: hypothetical protein [Thalassobaculum]SDF44660.1 hypothetical protein SAMN05660686_01390 [Thalassobaculum litoreum DSM 18839]